jgi:hypothetical protein
MLIALNEAFDKDTIDNLIFLSKIPRKTLGLSGDGVLKFSKLISADLAQFEIIIRNGPLIVYDVYLTQKGLLLFQAWQKGEDQELRKVLSS